MGLSIELSLKNSSCGGASCLLVSHCSDKIPTEQLKGEDWLQFQECSWTAAYGSRHVRLLTHILVGQEAGEGEHKHLATLLFLLSLGPPAPEVGTLTLRVGLPSSDNPLSGNVLLGTPRVCLLGQTKYEDAPSPVASSLS